MIELTNKDGRSIQVLVDNYFREKQQVAARINGEGRVVTFKTDVLDEASIAALEEWYEGYAIAKLLRFEIVREPGDQKGTCHFKVMVTSASNHELGALRCDYTIAFKKRRLVEKEESSSTASSNKKSKTFKFEEIDSYEIREGVYELESIPARGRVQFVSDTVPTENTQTIVRNKDKGPEDVRVKNSVQGIHLKVYSKDRLLREIESKSGMKQIIEKYSRG
ncbi:MAG: hypothetical protein ACPGKS_06565 [Coraliomargarita sp.]